MMLPYLFHTDRMHTFLAPEPVKPVEEQTDVLSDYNRGLAMDEDVGIKKSFHG